MKKADQYIEAIPIDNPSPDTAGNNAFRLGWIGQAYSALYAAIFGNVINAQIPLPEKVEKVRAALVALDEELALLGIDDEDMPTRPIAALYDAVDALRGHVACIPRDKLME